MMPIERQFFQAARAWYSKTALAELNLVDEIQFGYIDAAERERPGAYELAMRWHKTPDGPAATLEVCDSAWLAFSEFAPLFRELVDWHDKTLTPAAFCEMLARHGFRDATEAERPSQHQAR